MTLGRAVIDDRVRTEVILGGRASTTRGAGHKRGGGAVKLRTVLLVGAVLPIALIVAVGLMASSILLDRPTAAREFEELVRSRRIFEELQAHRQALIRAQARAVTEEPRLKAAVATVEPNRETLLDVAFDMKATLGSDLFVLTDVEG